MGLIWNAAWDSGVSVSTEIRRGNLGADHRKAREDSRIWQQLLNVSQLNLLDAS